MKAAEGFCLRQFFVCYVTARLLLNEGNKRAKIDCLIVSIVTLAVSPTEERAFPYRGTSRYLLRDKQLATDPYHCLLDSC